jgi:ABC-type multidrug transport system ATPase subunit
MSGSVCFNGERLSPNIKKHSAYVQQTDLHLARLTVRSCYSNDTLYLNVSKVVLDRVLTVVVQTAHMSP